MNKLVLKLSALVALFSFSACDMTTTPYHAGYRSEIAATQSFDSNQYDGYVMPTDRTGCVRLDPSKDPPLPKNVPNATWYSGGSPPAKYQKDIRVTLYFDNPNVINNTLVGGKKPACNATLFAYTYPPHGKKLAVMHLPNPCTYPSTDAYARLACHEMGHANGWPSYHGDL
jgi:hypothetical protein